MNSVLMILIAKWEIKFVSPEKFAQQSSLHE